MGPHPLSDRHRLPRSALTHAGLVDRHLSDGRSWLLGGDEPTFSDITLATAIAFSKFPVNATPLDERFEHIDAFFKRWQTRPTFLAAYADRNSGVPELDNRPEPVVSKIAA